MLKTIRRKFERLRTTFNERDSRLWAANEAREIGYGAVSLVWRPTGVSRRAIHKGINELDTLNCRDTLSVDRIRRVGGGRKPVMRQYPKLHEHFWTGPNIRQDTLARLARVRQEVAA